MPCSSKTLDWQPQARQRPIEPQLHQSSCGSTGSGPELAQLTRFGDAGFQTRAVKLPPLHHGTPTLSLATTSIHDGEEQLVDGDIALTGAGGKRVGVVVVAVGAVRFAVAGIDVGLLQADRLTLLEVPA